MSNKIKNNPKFKIMKVSGATLVWILRILTGMIIIAIIILYFYHPVCSVDVVMLTEKLIFLPEKIQPVILIEHVPINLLGLQGFSFNFIAQKVISLIQEAGEGSIGLKRLFFTPMNQDARITFLYSRLQIIELKANGDYKFKLWLRDSNSFNQINMEICGGETQVQIALLDDTIQVQSEEYNIKIGQEGNTFELTAKDCYRFRFLPDPYERNLLISSDSAKSLIFYDLDISNFDPSNEDLLQLPLTVKHIDFINMRSNVNDDSNMLSAKFVSLNIGEETKLWSKEGMIFINKQDLRGFELRKVRASLAGQLEIALHGNTGIFRAGSGQKTRNQIPSAISYLQAQLGLIIGLLFWIINLYFSLMNRLKKKGDDRRKRASN